MSLLDRGSVDLREKSSSSSSETTTAEAGRNRLRAKSQRVSNTAGRDPVRATTAGNGVTEVEMKFNALVLLLARTLELEVEMFVVEMMPVAKVQVLPVVLP